MFLLCNGARFYSGFTSWGGEWWNAYHILLWSFSYSYNDTRKWLDMLVTDEWQLTENRDDDNDHCYKWFKHFISRLNLWPICFSSHTHHNLASAFSDLVSPIDYNFWIEISLRYRTNWIRCIRLDIDCKLWLHLFVFVLFASSVSLDYVFV